MLSLSRCSRAVGPALFAACASFASLAQAESALIVKTGAYTLSEESQVIAGIPIAFDDEASPVFGGELEWRTPGGFGLSAELLAFSNDWITVGSSGSTDSLLVMFNAKKYFDVGAVRPFIGAGVGAASTSFEGPGGTATASGAAVQGLVGMEIRLRNLGLYAEYKLVSATVEDAEQEEVDLSGKGMLVGVSFSF